MFQVVVRINDDMYISREENLRPFSWISTNRDTVDEAVNVLKGQAKTYLNATDLETSKIADCIKQAWDNFTPERNAVSIPLSTAESVTVEIYDQKMQKERSQQIYDLLHSKCKK